MSQSLVSESEIFKSSAKMNVNKENIKCSVNKTTFYKVFKMESTRKLSNINFQWTKIFYQNNIETIIAFFFTFFKGYRYNYR